MSRSALPFTEKVLSSFRPGKFLENHQAETAITSLDFDDSGVWCLSAGEDESIQLYDCRTGKHSKTSYSKKYGVGLARFTHDANHCVYSSTKEDDTIRYLSLVDNSYIRYMKGHTGRVISLEVSPSDNTLVSAALDNTVRVWDLRSPTCQGLLSVNSPSFVAFDATGGVVGVASQASRTISVYPTTQLHRKPFLTINIVQVPLNVNWVKLEFSNNGKLIMLVTDSDAIYIFDAITGTSYGVLAGHIALPKRKSQGRPSHACFSVDGNYVFAASGDKKLYGWDVSTMSTETEISRRSPKISLDCYKENAYILQFSPRTMLLATANSGVTFWVPDRTGN